MGKKARAPWGYRCPWQEACPHLEGMSTHWMWERHQEDIWENHDLRRQVDELRLVCREQERTIRQLEKEYAGLKAQLDALHRKQFKAGTKSSSAGQDAPPQQAQEKKKRGAPKGHPPWTRRRPRHVDRRVRVPAPRRCPHCQSRRLEPCQERSEHLQEDIVLCPRTHVTCFDHEQAWCPVCQRAVLQTAEGELPGSYRTGGCGTPAMRIWLTFTSTGTARKRRHAPSSVRGSRAFSTPTTTPLTTERRFERDKVVWPIRCGRREKPGNCWRD